MTPLLLALPLLQAASDGAIVAILAETKVTRMAGVPAMPDLPPGIKLPAGVVLPGRPSRALSIRLWASVVAPKDASAFVSPPSGLKQGGRLDLELARPSVGRASRTGVEIFDDPRYQDMTIKVYWGSSEKVREGQPKIVRIGSLKPEQRAAMMRTARGLGDTAQADWTTGTWPTAKHPGTIGMDAALAGTFAINTSFTGNATLDVPRGVDFLPPIALNAPDLEEKPDLGQALPFRWSALPNALGQFAYAFGMEGKGTMILWTSSETYREALTSDPGFLEMAQVRELVDKDAFLAPNATRATIPAGIFKNADMAMATLVAYGPGIAVAKGQPSPRLQTRSVLNVTLGGKMMRDER